MKDKNVSIAEKIALFDLQYLPKFNDDNDIANENMMLGNKYNGERRFQEAIDAFNLCLCASKSLEEQGIAYANRALTYLGLKSYQDCLDSIRLAKECPLSEQMMKNVVEREEMAIEGLESEVSNSGVADNSDIPPVELSYRRHKRIPSFAFCLKLKNASNPYGGIITTEDLLPGDVLVVEQPISQFAASCSKNCAHCMRRCGSLKPCDCGYTMFCSLKCKEEAWEAYHKFECCLMGHLIVFSPTNCLILRVFFMLIQRFKDFSSLREYFEKIKNQNPFDGVDDFEVWPDSGSFESQFRLYYGTLGPSEINCTVRKQNLFRCDVKNKNLYISMAKTSVIIDILKTCKDIPCIAKSAEEWSFLSEQLFRLFFYKTFTILNIPVYKAITYDHDEDNETQINTSNTSNVGEFMVPALFGSASLFKTSICQFNVQMDYQQNAGAIVRATKYIPRGSELIAFSL